MDDLAGPTTPDIDEAVLTDEDSQLLSLKDGDTFLVADSWGDVLGGADGLFSNDTRILSHFRLLIGERRPARLSFGLSRDNAAFTVNGANHRLPPIGGRSIQRGVIHIERKRCLRHGRMFERVRLANFGLDEVLAPLAFAFDADFKDMFEVRGLRRARRGRSRPPQATGRGMILAYDGLDGVERRSVIAFSQPPWRITPRQAEFMFPLPPGQHTDLFVEVGPDQDDPPDEGRFNRALTNAHSAVGACRDRGASLTTSDSFLGVWLDQSRIDMAVLTTELATGPYPYAGIPWFSTTFGRDGIIAAWQMLWLDPSLARGVLAYLASRQAQTTSTFDDATPGKIMHEARRGEMAALGEVPFGAYYGGVDTTALFVALAGAYLTRTGDLTFIAELWPALCKATAWLEIYGDCRGDGLIYYERAEATGLSNQGWKDSGDSVSHGDGRLASGPIALVEVQGYAYAAWQAMALMGRRLGEQDADRWAERAEAMRLAVETRFWMEDLGNYALAVEGDGAVCGVESSNPGHLLFVGLPSLERAGRVTARLLSADFDSGWGLRTLSTAARRFNPMSYHNGSIWPHDTALALAGMARYGERAGVIKIMGDLREASKHFANRMPELLCGFARNSEEPPIAYPVACMPQAWAAGSAFMMLQAALGVAIDAARWEIAVVRPSLPPGVGHIHVRNLAIGDAVADLEIKREGSGVSARLGATSHPSISLTRAG